MKKPDNVCDNPLASPYPTNVGAPAFSLPDTSLFRNEKTNAARTYLVAQMNEIQERYNALVELAKDTALVYEAEYRFTPRVGHLYHLYAGEEKPFLSMIKPHEWDKPYLGSFRFTSEATWEKLELE